MISLGVIGYGYWGPNLVRNFSEITGSRVVFVSDLSSDRLGLVGARYPRIRTSVNYLDLINNPDVDAVVIATPVSSHFEIAQKALLAGKHVLVEKPMTATAEQGQILIDIALKKNLILMVDHTFVYMGAIRKIKSLIQSGDLGDILYFDSTRVNLGLFQHDVSVVWDLAVHDLSILDYLLGSQPVAVSSTGASHVRGRPENLAYMTYFFDSPLIAHINVNWLSPVKLRSMLIGGDKKMLFFDDLQPSEKIRVYDSGILVESEPEVIYQTLIKYRTGDMFAPKFDTTEALKVEALHFIDCIEHTRVPDTNGEVGLRIVKSLEAATKSLNSQGSLVKICP